MATSFLPSYEAYYFKLTFLPQGLTQAPGLSEPGALVTVIWGQISLLERPAVPGGQDYVPRQGRSLEKGDRHHPSEVCGFSKQDTKVTASAVQSREVGSGQEPEC